MRTIGLLIGLLGLGCGSSASELECSQDEDCSLEAGGVCLQACSTRSWCAYSVSDATCASGQQWSDFRTGDGLSGECLSASDLCAIADAGATDSGADASGIACTPKVVFVSTRDGNGEIYTVNPDGTDLTNLTNDVLADSAPAWSPDGLQIAYSKEVSPGMEDIFVMNWDGSNPRNITQTPALREREVSWSPSGGRLVFTATDGGMTELVTIDPDGTDSVTITNGDVLAMEPLFTRAGNQVIFTDNFSGIFAVSALGGTYSTINATGWHGKWSPIEDLITYTGFTPENDIYVRPPSGGTGTTQLTETTDELESFWYPDGSKILFISIRDFNEQIYVMDKDGSNEVRISGGMPTDSAREPSMSPDSSEVAFVANRDPTGGVFKMNIDGTGETVLSLENTASEPAWSPCLP